MGIEQLAANTLRGLAMDAVQMADSGHPGMPLGMADIAVALWSRFLTVDPDDPTWADRDRFVLSNGHGSALLYAVLHLAGFPVTLDDLRAYRQWGSSAAGHPEIDRARGVDMTTGPLGQGFATAVGMAIAEEHLRAVFGADLVNHRTFAFVSDGDLMEGLSSEAASLAGHLGLGRLVYLYDDNGVSIDGDTSITFTEDVDRRFQAAEWHVLSVDGHDQSAVVEAIEEALAVADRPSLIRCHTVIGFGAPNLQGTSKVHGSPLGESEVRAAKRALGLPVDQELWVSDEVYRFFSKAMDRGRSVHARWTERFEEADDDTVELWESYFAPTPIRLEAPAFGDRPATRVVSGMLFDQIAAKSPGFVGGAADLAVSTKTKISSSGHFTREDRSGRNIAYGVREDAMGAVTNGLAIHGGLRPYGSTYLVFSDYMRPSVRLGALMEAPSIWVWTHDSVLIGEDGPTHQPIEHLASLRAMPNLWIIRPADATETVEAWELALNRTEGPTALVLARQGVPTLQAAPGVVARGGYVLSDGDDVVLIATGSEVHLALEAAEILDARGVSARVVSLPCWEAFFAQTEQHRRSVLGVGMPRVSLEAASTFGWERITGSDGLNLGIDSFGASAPSGVIADHLGFTPEQVAARVGEWLGRTGSALVW